ncbi:uncharacterized protein LTR77_004583 [Saxophila tyrrhenica]|uniref:Uncharacterized protein n=1 Tax=Saxophila tyrrhenica TaxID=1690608 RepID=A0AAV9PD34_9PEZI|nr:hypothetical protein LTR77_004583 [Saxophila tyrrhenica]
MSPRKAGTPEYASCLPFVDMQKARKGEEEIDSTKVNRDEWRPAIAMHLATTPHFVQHFIQTQAQPDQYSIVGSWLAQVYCRGRYAVNKSFGDWIRQWWVLNKDDVVQDAQNLILEVYHKPKTDIAAIRTRIPDFDTYSDKDTTAKRQKLFKLHTTRLQLRTVVSDLTTAQYHLATDILNCLSEGDTESAQQKRQAVINELTMLDEAKAELRAPSKDSALDRAAIQMLDGFLKAVPPQQSLHNMGDDAFDLQMPGDLGGTIPDLGAADTSPNEPSDEEPTSEVTKEEVADIIKKLMALKDFEPDYVNGKKALEWESGVWLRKTAVKKRAFADIQDVGTLSGLKFVDLKTLAEYEADSAEWLHSMSASWTPDQRGQDFELVFRQFERLTERPLICRNTKRGADMWQTIGRHNLSILEDNVVHVRCIVAEMWQKDLFRRSTTEDDIDLAMRRLYALLSLLFGACEEPGILCTVLDRLLEDLAGLLKGHVDPKMETIRMSRAMEAISQSSEKNRAKYPSFNHEEKTVADMKMEHTARVLFAELARMFRGAFIGAVAQTHTSQDSMVKHNHQSWFAELLKWSSDCGHPSCTSQVELLDISREDQAKHAVKQASGISVSVIDARIGFPNERSEISTNRPYAYLCLSKLIRFMKFHVGLAPFFHYFTHLYHPSCRPFRGKTTLINDITFHEKRTARRSIPQGDEPADPMDIS